MQNTFYKCSDEARWRAFAACPDLISRASAIDRMMMNPIWWGPIILNEAKARSNAEKARTWGMRDLGRPATRIKRMEREMSRRENET
jgi:hypothetical protein